MTASLGGICVGYGGLEMAIEQLLPVRHAWHVEFDEAASKVLKAHWPEVPNYGDVTKVDWARVEPVDVFGGGVPCQGWSLAGKQLGADDDRDLWPVRKFEKDGISPRRGALDAIRALRPRLVVIENVRGLLTHRNGQDFATILADLDDLGYTVSWTVIGACMVGACHHRHRVFIAATLIETPLPVSDPVAHRSAEGWTPAQFVLFGDAGSVNWPASGFTSGGTAWELPVETCGIDGSASPTPKANDTGTPGRKASEGWRPPLSEVLLNVFPTPTANLGDERRGSPSLAVASRRFGLGRRNLDDAVAMLPTPVARDVKGANIRNADSCLHGALLPTPTATPYGNNQSYSAGAAVRPSLEALVQMLPTPTVADSRGTRNATAGRSETASATVNTGWTLSDVVYDGQIQSLLPTPRASDGEKGGPNQGGSSGDVMLPAAVQPERFGKYAAAVHRHEHAYGLAAPDPTEPGRNGKPRLSPAFPEFMQGLPPGWLTDVVARKDALKLAGNGVNPRQAAYALATLPTFRAAVAALTTVDLVSA